MEVLTAIAIFATIAAAYISGKSNATAAREQQARRDLNRQLVAMFYALGDLRVSQIQFKRERGQAWFHYQEYRKVLGELLREFAVIAAELPEHERAKAMKVYRHLSQVTHHNCPASSDDALAGHHDLLVGTYPELLDELRRDDGEHAEFHRLTGEPETHALPSVAERKRLHSADLERDDAAE
ncbi:MAG TPA: hypothetical protein VG755_07920 [Nannocystaceae bacterium]|nr:hypothetical protein [Nannocystaceae bacterium]